MTDKTSNVPGEKSPQLYGYVGFELFTSGDDFRGDGGEALRVELLGINDTVIETIPQANFGGTLTVYENGAWTPKPQTGNPNHLPNFSWYNNVVKLGSAILLSDLRKVRLTLIQGNTGINNPDNWSVGVIMIYLTNLGPNYFILNVGNTSVDWTWRFKVNQDAGEHDNGPTYTHDVPYVMEGSSLPPGRER